MYLSIYARANAFHLLMYLNYGNYLIDDCYTYIVFFIFFVLGLHLYLDLLRILGTLLITRIKCRIKKCQDNKICVLPPDVPHATTGTCCKRNLSSCEHWSELNKAIKHTLADSKSSACML